MATEENPTVPEYAPLEPAPSAVVDELTVNPEDGSDHGDSCSCHVLSPEAEAVLELRESARLEGVDPHEQVPFLGFTVDHELQGVIENLWVMGMPTDFSCQGDLELCHPEIPSSDYHAQIVFIRVSDAIRFLSMLTETGGAGTGFGAEGFEFAAMDGDLEDIYEAGHDEDHPDFAQWAFARARGEVRFHPGYIYYIRDLLNNTVELNSHYSAKREALRSAPSLEDAYEEALSVSPEFREIAEKSCECC